MKVTSVVLVLIQAVCSIGLVFSNGIIPGNIFLVILWAAGILLGIWAMAEFRFRFNIFPELLEDSMLLTSGPYRYVRHPIYTAVLMITLAYLINTPKILNYIMWIILLLVLVIKLNYEEKLLMKRFPDYREYKARTKRLIPFVI